MQLNYRDSRPIYAQIIDHYREQITAGVLLPGDRLPSVRELASRISINPNTIQRSYRQLELEGWIVTVPGKGCFVCGGTSVLEREKERLLQSFDETVAALRALGLENRDLVERIGKEENKNA